MLVMGQKAWIFQGLIILSVEASPFSSWAVRGVTCWDVKAGPVKLPSLSQTLFPLPCGGVRDKQPPRRPAALAQSEPWKDSRGPGPTSLPALKLIRTHCAWRHPTWPTRGAKIDSLCARCLLCPWHWLWTPSTIQSGQWMRKYLQEAGFQL